MTRIYFFMIFFLFFPQQARHYDSYISEFDNNIGGKNMTSDIQNLCYTCDLYHMLYYGDLTCWAY